MKNSISPRVESSLSMLDPIFGCATSASVQCGLQQCSRQRWQQWQCDWSADNSAASAPAFGSECAATHGQRGERAKPNSESAICERYGLPPWYIELPNR